MARRFLWKLHVAIRLLLLAPGNRIVEQSGLRNKKKMKTHKI
jgi:hypothetical protein